MYNCHHISLHTAGTILYYQKNTNAQRCRFIYTITNEIESIEATCAVSTVPVPGALFMIEFIILLEISKARLQIIYVQATLLLRGSENALCGQFLTLLVL